MQREKKPLFTLFFVAALSLTALACANDDDDATPNEEPPTPMSDIRVLHLSPDAPPVDIIAEESLRAIENLPFGQGTDYLELASGAYRFDIVPTGAPVDDSVLTLPEVGLEPDKSYTVMAVGGLSQLEVLAVEEDRSDPGEGMIRVRAIHAAPGVGEVDIWNVPESGEATPLYENVPFGAVGNYLEIPAGTYHLGFDVNDDQVPDLSFDIEAGEEGLIANLIAVNDIDGNVFLLAQLSDSAILEIAPH